MFPQDSSRDELSKSQYVMFFKFNYYSAPVYESHVLPCITNGLAPSINASSASGTDTFLGNLNKKACILGEHTVHVIDHAALESLYGPHASSQILFMFRMVVMLCHLYSGRFYNTDLLLARLAALTKPVEYKPSVTAITRGIIDLIYAKCTKRINFVVCDTCSLKLPDGIYFTENATALMIRQNVLFGNFPELRFLAAAPDKESAMAIKCNPLSSHEKPFSLSKLPFMPSIIYPMIPGEFREYLAVMHDTYGHQQASMLMYAASRREAMESNSSTEFAYSNIITTISTSQPSTKLSIKTPCNYM
jgi:hypothetical protein